MKVKMQSKNKALTTLNQAICIAKWINKFKPENITLNDLTLPKELLNYQNLVTETLDDIKDLALTRENDFETK